MSNINVLNLLHFFDTDRQNDRLTDGQHLDIEDLLRKLLNVVSSVSK